MLAHPSPVHTGDLFWELERLVWGWVAGESTQRDDWGALFRIKEKPNIREIAMNFQG